MGDPALKKHKGDKLPYEERGGRYPRNVPPGGEEDEAPPLPQNPPPIPPPPPDGDGAP